MDLMKTEKEVSQERDAVQEQILVELQKQNEQPEPQPTRAEKIREALSKLMNKTTQHEKEYREKLTEAFKNR